MNLIVAVTGGIGSGKSTAARLFQERGAGLVDTDGIARELTLTGRPALDKIVGRFGPEYLAADGSLDRGKLRIRVFSDSDARQALEDILHPLIRREVEGRELPHREAARVHDQ
jgi:dephospho-CoA kinase